MKCAVCSRGPAWGIKLHVVGGDTMACDVDLVEAVNLAVRTLGVGGIKPQYRQHVRRQLVAVAC